MLDNIPPEHLVNAIHVAGRAARTLENNYPSYTRADAAQTGVAAILDLYARTKTLDQSHWFMVARNALVDELRYLQPRRCLNVSQNSMDIMTEGDGMEKNEDVFLRNHLRNLPQPEREAVISIVMWETSAGDFAASAGISIKTAKSRVARGLTRLRAVL